MKGEIVLGCVRQIDNPGFIGALLHATVVSCTFE
jgi:hypothetical protein